MATKTAELASLRAQHGAALDELTRASEEAGRLQARLNRLDRSLAKLDANLESAAQQGSLRCLDGEDVGAWRCDLGLCEKSAIPFSTVGSRRSSSAEWPRKNRP